MKIPQLYDWSNPTAPKWSNVDADPDEVDGLFQACVMILGYDPRSDARDRYVVLGSGFLISAESYLTVMTAAHIFTWWTDQIRPAIPHALTGVQGDHEDAGKRLRYVLEHGYIVAAVDRRGIAGRGSIARIEHFSGNVRPADMDIAIVQLSMPEGRSTQDYRVLRFDTDPLDFRDPVLMAGHIGGGRYITVDDDNERLFGAAYWEQKLAVRAGRVAEYVSDSNHPHRHMYRVSIPSLPGMSGGPLVAMRATNGVIQSYFEPTAIGVISSSGFAEPMLLDHCEDGETWVTPVAHSLARKVTTPDGIRTLSEAIRSAHIDAFGEVAARAIVSRDPTTGVVTYGLEGKKRK